MITRQTIASADERPWRLEFDRLPGRNRSAYRLRLVPTVAQPDDAIDPAEADDCPLAGPRRPT